MLLLVTFCMCLGVCVRSRVRACVCNVTGFVLSPEFGVFVNCGGRRSRQEDIRWSGLPLTFGESL